MSNHPTLSVITVCFNSEAYVSDALRSVDIQTYQACEHIVVDGASNDATLRVLSEHGRAWRRVVSEPDQGIYDAMNKGLALAQGEVIGFINSDDFYASPNALAQVAATFADSSVDACYGDLCYVKQDQTNQVVRYWRSSAFRPGLFRLGWCPPHPTFFVRRSVYERLGGFDLSYRMGNDVELMARFMEVHRIKTAYLPELLVKMRMGGESNGSWSGLLLQNREVLRALKTHQLQPELLPFVGGKLRMRARQFLTRPE